MLPIGSAASTRQWSSGNPIAARVTRVCLSLMDPPPSAYVASCVHPVTRPPQCMTQPWPALLKLASADPGNCRRCFRGTMATLMYDREPHGPVVGPCGYLGVVPCGVAANRAAATTMGGPSRFLSGIRRPVATDMKSYA